MQPKDEIYTKKKEQLQSVIGFIKAIDNNLNSKEAFKIVSDAAANFMISHYEKIIKGAPENEKFSIFRKYYEKYPKISSYCEIIESNSQILKVKFTRCPLNEILRDENLSKYAAAYCQSDKAFTDALLPNVKFNRTKGIIDGDKYCILSWKSKKNK